MSHSPNPSAAYTAWYSTTHLSQELYGSRLDEDWQIFCARFKDGPDAGGMRMERLVTPTISHLHTINGLVNRWPSSIRCTLAQGPLPFATWAQPKYQSRREQAVAVWYTMLKFIIFAWTLNRSGDELRNLGFEPDREFIDLIDDLHLYVSIQDGFRPRKAVVIEKVEEFFLKALRDPKPTVRTNPLLWWIAVLIHCEVVQRHGSPPIFSSGTRDTLGFSGKLEALEHYARVLVFTATMLRWTRTSSTPHPHATAATFQQDVMRWVDQANIQWVDANADEPPHNARAEPDLSAPAWEAWHKVLREQVQKWLMWNSEGPMREILALKVHAMPLARRPPPQNLITGAARPAYRVKHHVIYDWQTDPRSLDEFPQTQHTLFADLQKANDAARSLAQAKLREALDYTEDDTEALQQLQELADMFKEDREHSNSELFQKGREGMHKAYDEGRTHDGEGLVRCRLLYCDGFLEDTVKVTAWVVKV